MSKRIRLRHPGYCGPNTLLSLPASDGPDRDRAHYATVHAAGAIITNNSFDGWLSTSSNGEPRAQPDDAGLLPAGEYFFHLSSADTDTNPYPIVPNFRAWRFPHQRLPPLWQQASDNDGNIFFEGAPSPSARATETCRITRKHLACETSHIIPTAEKQWFADNEMDTYGELAGRTGEAIADSSANLLRLRSDAHYLWDALQFSIVPREPAAAAAGGGGGGERLRWFTQMMNEDEEIYHDWHHKELQPLHGRAPQYIFSRFAWDIFPKLHAFLQASQARRLAVRQSTGEVEVKMYNPMECRRFTLGQGRGRSASPTKRARHEVEEVADTDSIRKRLRSSSTASMSRSFDSAVGSMELGSSSAADEGVDDVEGKENVGDALPPSILTKENHADYRRLRVRSADLSQQHESYLNDVAGEEHRGRKRRRS